VINECLNVSLLIVAVENRDSAHSQLARPWSMSDVAILQKQSSYEKELCSS